MIGKNAGRHVAGPAIVANGDQRIGLATGKDADKAALAMLVGAQELPRLNLLQRQAKSAQCCRTTDGPGISFPARGEARNGLTEQALAAQQVVVIAAHDSASAASARWRL